MILQRSPSNRRSARRIATAALLIIGVYQAAPVGAAGRLEIEIATQAGLSPTAPHEWARLLGELGFDRVQLRGQRREDEPRIDEIGTPQRPSYRLIGILTSRNELIVPRGKFRTHQRDSLRTYLVRLSTDGPAAIVAEKGAFGLTLVQFEGLHADLGQTNKVETAGQTVSQWLAQVRGQLNHPVVIDHRAETKLLDGGTISDKLSGLTLGSALAIALREQGLALQPRQPLGEPVSLFIVAAPQDPDKAWPPGWKPTAPLRRVAPAMFEKLDAEIDGFTLRDTLAAIQPRLEIPLLLDHHVLSENRIDPETALIKVPPRRTSYKRLLDSAVAKARLEGQLKVDEAGTPFYWITTRRRPRR